MAGEVFAVASGKGGVGKTTTVVNLGVVLRRADHSVALVDADLGMANLGTVLGIKGDLTLHDVLAGDAAVAEALVEEAPGFGVLPGSDDLASYAEADPSELRDVLETLAAEYDFVVVDTGAGMSHEDVLPLGLADRVVLVATPDPAALGDTRKTAELVALVDGTVAGLVVTMATGSTDTTYAASEVGVDLLGVIPFDPTVRESTASGRPLEAVDPDTPAAVAYRELAARLTDASVEPASDAGAEAPGERAGTDVDAGEAAPGDGADDSVSADPASSPGRSSELQVETSDAATRPAAAVDESVPETAEASTGEAVEVAEDAAMAPSEGAPDSAAADEEEDYLAEFEDDDEPRGGLLAKIGRLFR